MVEASTPQAATTNRNAVQNETGPRLLYIIVLTGSAVSLLLQFIGLVTPGWQVVNLNVQSIDLTFSMGLWLVDYCVDETCDSVDLETFWDKHYKGPRLPGSQTMMEYRVETILAILAVIVGVVCISKIICCSPNGIYSNTRTIWQIILASTALSATLALTASVRYGQVILEAHNAFEDTTKPSPYKEPWSLMVTGVGGVISGVVFVVMVIETCRAVNYINREQGQDFPTPVFPEPVRPYVSSTDQQPPVSSLRWPEPVYDPNYGIKRYK